MRRELTIGGFRLDMSSRRRRRTLVVLVYLFLSGTLACVGLWAPSNLANCSLFLFAVFLANRFVFGGRSTRGLVQPFSPDLRPIWFKDDPPPSSAIDRWFWRRSPSRKDLQTDERDERRRDRAHYLAYRVLAFLTMLVWLLFAIVRKGPQGSSFGISFDFALFASVAAAMLAMTLPQAILLWTEPDMEAEAAGD